MFKHLLSIILIFTSLSLVLAQGDTEIPPASFSPESVDGGILCAEEILQFPLVVTIPGLDIPPIEALDIMILMDTTGSMGSQIDAVKNNTQQIIDGLRLEIADTRFGFATFNSEDEDPFILDADFSTDLNSFNAALAPVRAYGGGNEVLLRGAWELAQLQWRENAIKVMVVFTDEFFLDPDPGRDGQRGTDDDITFEGAIADLQAQGIQVIAVQSGSGSGLATILQELADETNGTYFQLRDAADIPELIVTGVSGLIAGSRFTFEPTGSGSTRLSSAEDNWFSQSPDNFRYDVEGVNQTVSITIDPVAMNLPDGVYTLNLPLIRRDDSFGTVPVSFEYYEVCSDFYIPDSESDDGTACTSNIFWESPNITLSYTEDGSGIATYPRAGQANFVFVDVFMSGPRDALATVEVFASDIELVTAFPNGWTSLGSLSAEMQSGVPMRFGPYEWQAQVDFTSLRAIVSNDNDLSENLADVACENNVASLHRTRVNLDSPTLGRGDNRVGGLLDLRYSGFAPSFNFITSELDGFVELIGQGGNSDSFQSDLPLGELELLIASTEISNASLPVTISDEVDGGLTIYYTVDDSAIPEGVLEIPVEEETPWGLIIYGIVFTIIGMLAILAIAVFSGSSRR